MISQHANRRPHFWFIVVLFSAIALLFAWATPAAWASTSRQADGPATIGVGTHEELGDYLVDGEGMSLYLFTPDEGAEESSCYDSCAEAWPPLLTDGEPTAGDEAVDASLLGTLEREDGSLQVTYNGWPLYHFVRDEAPGDIRGQEIESFGGEWYLVSPQGNKQEAEAHEEGQEGGQEGSEAEAATNQQQRFQVAVTTYLMETAGFHDIDERLNAAGEIQSSDLTSVHGIQRLLATTDWPEALQAAVDPLMAQLDALAQALADEDGEAAAPLAADVHSLQHDFSPLVDQWLTAEQAKEMAKMAAESATLQVASNEELGDFLVDSQGMTLYLFLKDEGREGSSCYDSCADNWPPLIVEEEPTVAEGVDPALVGTIEREDGSLQVTYDGWPLYYFARDEASGDTAGQGAGDVWYVVSPTAESATLQVASNDELGDFLVDSQGMTLYLFLRDEGMEGSSCYDRCADNWPPLIVEEEPTVGEGVDPALVGTTEREDGSLQITYNGWPLYYFVRDEASGDTAGQGAGDVWYVVSPAGEAVQQ